MSTTRIWLVLAILVISIAYRPNRSLSYKFTSVNSLAKNLDTGKTYEIEAGKPVSLAAVNTGLRLSFQCKSGNCGSCEFLLNGKIVRSCITKTPSKDFTLKKKKKG